MYRYSLTRVWNVDPSVIRPRTLVVVGLNPSTADEKTDDPTIRRCMGFARSWGYDGLSMVNLFAFRSTDPTALKLLGRDPVGPENDRVLRDVATGRRVLCAWGVHGAHQGRDRTVMKLLAGADLVCLERTKGGHPKHPLYVRADTVPIPYTARV